MPENREGYAVNERYVRQVPLLGEAGQKKLHDTTVFIAGAGGLGSPASLYLAAAGIGSIRICDLDVIELSNMNRQILHTEERIGASKAESAKMTLESLNPECRVTSLSEKIDEASVRRLIGNADIIVDCMDNFSARFALNKAALDLGLPLMHGAVSGFTGQATLVVPGKTPCLSCIFQNAKTTAKTPVIGAAAGVIGSIEAAEVIKHLTGIGITLAGRLLLYDGAQNSMEVFTVKKSPRCPVCTTL